MPTLHDLYWVAGFLEGEGSFCNAKTGTDLTAYHVELEPLEKLKNILGGKIYFRKTKNISVWMMTGSKAIGVMMTLYSLMSRKRQKQIMRALEGWRKRGPHYRYRTKCPKGHLYTGLKTINGKVYRQCLTCAAKQRIVQDMKRRVTRRGKKFKDQYNLGL